MKEPRPLYAYTPTCTCADKEGFTTILNNHITVGITTQFQENGVFKNNHSVSLENRFCPRCGAPRLIKEIKSREDDRISRNDEVTTVMKEDNNNDNI